MKNEETKIPYLKIIWYNGDVERFNLTNKIATEWKESPPYLDGFKNWMMATNTRKGVLNMSYAREVVLVDDESYQDFISCDDEES